MNPSFQQVAIVGVGLIGGSLGMVLKQQGLAKRVIGVGRSIENLELAVKVGAIDRYERDPQRALPGTDLIVLATPLERYADHLTKWADCLEAGTVITDVGSVKRRVVEQAQQLLPAHAPFVGAHPIAGKETSGVAAASPDLFRGATCVLTPTAQTNTTALRRVRAMWERAGSTIITMEPDLHDWILGAVSHLPHVAAFALMNVLRTLEASKQEGLDLLAYSGGGLRDTTRIAASSPEMWRDICLWNRDNLLTMIDQYIGHLQAFRNRLDQRDAQGLEALMSQAREARARLR